MRDVAIVALVTGLLAAPAQAAHDAAKILAPIMGKMCAGTVGKETPIRIFFRPVVLADGTVAMQGSGDFIKTAEQADATQPWPGLQTKCLP